MKHKTLSFFIALPTLLLTLAVQAHDPQEHNKAPQQPNCAAMKNMDHSKMDMNDPVMLALMQKCMKQMHHEETDANHEHPQLSEPEEQCEAKDTEHVHEKDHDLEDQDDHCKTPL